MSNQALAEMKEKIKILQNEIEILRNECKVKDRELAKECASHQGAQIQRDALRYDTNKSQAEYKKKQVRWPEETWRDGRPLVWGAVREGEICSKEAAR